ncbi:MAG: aspartate--tRNA(Asn) ligase [Spirochaetaceae bacterium]|jgi:nondiscriminating aspartyl-tRNA synthetase|nr:aspartate--tRNA(Asn) ligase [Spirochaetaceae bacterium]
MRTLARDISQAARDRPGETITVSGWVHRIRDMGGITFVVLRDRSGMAQIVFSEPSLLKNSEASGEKPAAEGENGLTLESVVTVSGIPALNEKAPGGAELRAASLVVVSRAMPELPYPVNGDIAKTGLETILDNRLLSVRNPKIRAIFNVQAVIIEAFSACLRSRDFTEIKTSKLVWGGTEGGTELFTVEYFDRKVCLAQSPQFYKEAMVASGMERVFEVAPAYRAEKHDTPRHLNEYVSLDVEMGFIESEKDLIDLERELLARIFEEVARKNAADLALWKASVPDAAAVAKAPVIAYEDAVKTANEWANGQAAKASGQAAGKAAGRKTERIFDINPEAERFLCDWSAAEYGTDLVFVNEFPRRYRPFYAYPSDANRTMSFDALFRGLEITTGGRRQHSYEAFVEVLPRFGLKLENMQNYAALLRYGCPPHGGFAIGCERLTARILGLANVKEASLFPRDRKRVAP